MTLTDKPSLSEAQIKRVWEGMLGAETRANYFADLVWRYNTEQKVLTWATLFSSSGALVTILATLPAEHQGVRLFFIGSAAALSLYSVVRQNPKNAVDATKLHSRWLKIANAYTEIWENVYSSDAKHKLDAATAMEAEASEASNGFPYKKRLMRKWEKHVVNHHGLQLQNSATTSF
ncbi:MAG TPA: hypothetical protein VLT36_02805 [Candidatus Dormibacteraeota bacterium]|nr:hypothetical protein [Candidatus Dormibacteraeota bacterium]